jgi:hypothetical protein
VGVGFVDSDMVRGTITCPRGRRPVHRQAS